MTFEEWLKGQHLRSITFEEVWLASREAALEEAAEMACVGNPEGNTVSAIAVRKTSEMIAIAIRALKHKEG